MEKINKELYQKLKEALEICIKKKIKGEYTEIDGYYVEFQFKKIKEGGNIAI